MAEKVKFTGTLQVPGDKSISHRALMFSLLGAGDCQVDGLSPAQDCQSTISCLRALGVGIEPSGSRSGSYLIHSPSLSQLSQPTSNLDAGNSGTTIRLLSGLLAGSNITCTLDGDESLRKRPMARVLDPLSQMGAKIAYLDKPGCPPFTITGAALTGKSFELPLASAQVQTAVLLAGLHAEGTTSVRLPSPVRDHTERMLRYIGVAFKQDGPLSTSVTRLQKAVSGYHLTVAGDISSAAFFMVAAACTPGSDLRLTQVGMNSGRTLVIDVLKEMGADVSVENRRELCGEPVADLHVKGTRRLSGATVRGDRIAAGIDEIPVLALAGALCDGNFLVRDAHELRVKESDRLSAIVQNFRRAGADVEEYEDGFQIHGKADLAGNSQWQTHGDHRLAMTGMLASLLCDGAVQIDDTDCAAVSYPAFGADLRLLALT
ncbi:MAG TPA: 3-phosphoshikimate 1-carboxyvinyltransferase [Candidatus Obscuribacterales bacterium]